MEVEEHEQSCKRSKEDDDKLIQLKINETIEALNPYSSVSQRHIAITRAVARMITTDFQPYSIVEDEGFRVLLRVLDRRYQLPSQKHFRKSYTTDV